MHEAVLPLPGRLARPIARLVRGLVAGLLVAAVGGCSGSGTSALKSQSLGLEPVVLDGRYKTVVYAHEPDGDTAFSLTDIPVNDLLAGTARNGQIMHIDLLWQPKAGATPMDNSATNSSVRHVVVADGEVGVYVGAGFIEPQGSPGRKRLRVSVRDTSLRLLEGTEGFTDPLTPARVTGTFTAIYDVRLAHKLHRAMSQFVTNAFGRTMFVDAAASGASGRGVEPSGLRR